MIKELKKINFPNYNIFSHVNNAYLNVVHKIVPFKDLRIKNNTQDWFNDEVAEAIKLRGKHLKQFKSTKLHIYENFYKESKYHVLKLIKEQKKSILQRKINRKYW